MFFVTVIVEEATEIIEAEIVVPLSEVCDQLILFGRLYEYLVIKKKKKKNARTVQAYIMS